MNSKLKQVLKNQYFQIIAGLLFGVQLIILFIDKKSYLGFIGIIGAVFIMANIIRLIDTLNGKKTDLKTFVLGTFLIPLLIGLFLGAWSNEFEHLDHIINGSELFEEFMVYGLITAIITAVYRYYSSPIINRTFSFPVLFSGLVIFPFSFITCASFINRYEAEIVEYPVETIVTEKESKISEEDDNDSQFSIFTSVGLYKEEFTVQQELWHTLEKNDTIVLYLKYGNLGFTIVDRIEKKTPKIPTPSPSQEGNRP